MRQLYQIMTWTFVDLPLAVAMASAADRPADNEPAPYAVEKNKKFSLTDGPCSFMPCRSRQSCPVEW
jgi:hypothetical protein